MDENIILIALGAIVAMLLLVNFLFALIVCIKMFKNGQTGMGIACLAMSFLCFGLGMPLAFVYGWMKAGEWKMKGLMIGWTGWGVVSFTIAVCLGVAPMVLGQKASATFSTIGQTIGR